MHACAQTFGVIQRRNVSHDHRCDVDDDTVFRHYAAKEEVVHLCDSSIRRANSSSES